MSIDVDHPVGGITARTRGRTVEITVGDGRKRNALSGTGWNALTRTLDGLAEQPETRAVVLRGAEGTFCAGSDLTEWIDADMHSVEQSFSRMETAFQAVERCPVPVVAEISGVAAGAGCQLALACDLRVMADTARIGMPIARLGINASPAFAARMSTLIGPSATRKLLYTGALLDAAEAHRHGMTDAVASEHELGAHTEWLLEAITDQPPTAIRAAKHAVAAAVGQPHTHGISTAHPPVDPDTFANAIDAAYQR